jgi:hypothetical protein
MKLTPQQYADKLIEQYLNCDKIEFDTTHEDAIRYSLIDVQNTIDAVTAIADKKYEHYQEVKQILESKL